MCNLCHLSGLKKTDCCDWKRQQENQNVKNTDKAINMTEKNNFIVFMASSHRHIVNDHLTVSCFDSSASNHLINYGRYFSVSKKLDYPITIGVTKSGESSQAFKEK